MTNTELIRQEIERRIGAMYNFSEGYSALNTCRELLDFIDKLPEEDETVTNCHHLEDAAEGMVTNLTIVDGVQDRCYIQIAMPRRMLNKLGMIGYGFGVYISKSGKNS